ncbi:hypothetical protein MRBLMR1_003953 [Neorhizobium sp. LMR1-1-1.1]
MSNTIPLAHMGRTEEVAAAAFFPASEESSLLRGNQDETRATIWMRFLGRGRDQVITLIAADKFFVIF